MLFVGVTAVMAFASFMLAVYLGLKGKWLLAAICLVCFCILMIPPQLRLAVPAEAVQLSQP